MRAAEIWEFTDRGVNFRAKTINGLLSEIFVVVTGGFTKCYPNDRLALPAWQRFVNALPPEKRPVPQYTRPKKQPESFRAKVAKVVNPK